MCGYENIKRAVKTVYGKKIKGADIEIFSDRLYNVINSRARISALYSEIFSCEYEAGLAGGSSCAWNMFNAVIPLLDDGKDTAQRLYVCFINELDDPAVFLKLVLHNEKYLTDEQLSEVKNKALKVFDRQFLEGVLI